MKSISPLRALIYAVLIGMGLVVGLTLGTWAVGFFTALLGLN